MAVKRSLFEEIAANKRRSWLIMLGFILLAALLGLGLGAILGSWVLGLIIALIIGLIYSLIGYFEGERMVLAVSGARPATKEEFPYLYHSVEALAVAAGLKKAPKVYVIDDTAMNAFATGKDPEHSSITVTTGLLARLNREELEGVLAHEMAHIKNYDIRMMMLAAVLTGAVVMLSHFMLRTFLWGGGRSKRDSRGGGQFQLLLILASLILAILAPLFAQLIKLAVSRRREYLADASGAALTRYPPGLASALEKIARDPDPAIENANPAISHLFISNPLRGKRQSFMATLFSTHPPIEDRIRRLRQL